MNMGTFNGMLTKLIETGSTESQKIMFLGI